jgi:2-polyprenyl-3-methyl-5-hydroxy-6-metoxy-1,4-benzoquinol methylase
MKNFGETGTTPLTETASPHDRAADAETNRAAVPLAHEAIHETVAQVLAAQTARGLLLDVPAGEGALAARLARAGFAVRCCDLYPQIFRLPGVEIKGGDLSATLPYEDESFDFITCVEGLEHIENPQQAVREFARLLRAGGQLVVTVPNILNIEERIKWLLHGYTSHFKPTRRAGRDGSAHQPDLLRRTSLHARKVRI